MTYVDPKGLNKRRWVKGQLVLESGAKILGWARDTKSGTIECGCGNRAPSDNSDVDFVFLPSASHHSGATTEMIKFYGTLTIHADGSRTNTGYDWARAKGRKYREGRFGDSNFVVNDSYDWFVAMGHGDKECEELFQYLPPAFTTLGTPENDSALKIRARNNKPSFRERAREYIRKTFN